MDLGAFSVSLSVKDIHRSFEFYSKLGYQVIGGDIKQNWVILKNGISVIGLFQGMFEKNILTFNPGWNQDGKDVSQFTDIRDIQNKLLNEGITINEKVSESTNGPAYFSIEDPDGNQILFDQHR